MSFNSFTFTAFAESDLFTGYLARGVEFTQPTAPSLTFEVTDNDLWLSGDFFDRALDFSGQHASISRDGAEAGNGRQVYAEKAVHLRGDDGQNYTLVEIEQEGSHANYYTYANAVPPAGVTLTVLGAADVRAITYDKLGSGDFLPNIVDIAAGSDDFNLLVMALSAAGLVDAVRDLDDITVFAPTDAAFTQLAVDLGFDGDTSDEEAVFGAIVEALTALGGGDPIPLLTDVLLYHVSGGAKSAADIDALDEVSTLLAGATFGSEGTELVDNEPDVTNPNIVIPDISADNGTIQAIDRVLLPIDIPGNEAPAPEETLAEIVAASGGTFDRDGSDFDLLFNAVKAAGLVDALNDPDADLTVFAPNDDAFVGLAQTLGFKGADEGEAFGYIVNALTLLSGGGDPIPLLTDILLYHVAPEALGSDDVLAASSIETLLGASLGVDGASLVDGDPDIANPNLIATDIEASNGIAHVLDGVLIPLDVLQGDGGAGSVEFKIGSDANETIFTGRNTDFVSGLGGDDIIGLGRGDDVGLGGDGDDQIKGGAGDDVLDGGAGNDMLIGGNGEDMLTGGADADVFLFNRSSGQDTITDFTVGEDVIQLKGFGIHDFDQIEHRITDTDAGALIDLGHVEITLTDVAAASLTGDEFGFL